jgi:endonuclease/exonuclease/phosphatase family metal-dependent hydrolase
MGVVLAELAVRVPPAEVPLLAPFGMAYPVASAALIIGAFGALWSRRWKAGLAGAFLLALSWPHVTATWGTLNAPSDTEAQQLKVVTWNVRQFNRYAWIERPGVRDSILSYLAAQEADVICLQECFLEDRRQPWMSADRLQQATGLTHWEEEFKLGRGQDKLFGLAVLSRFPILAKSAIRFDNDKNNSGMYVDLLVGGDTVRVYNMHLSSIGFEKEDYEDARNVQDEAARTRLYNRLAAAWQKRTDQAEQIAASVAQSPHPVIAVGDFNDTPVSYAAQRFSAHLRDAYRSAEGIRSPVLGASYIGDLPFLRIDQVWASPEIEVADYRTGQVELSDHRPVSVAFQWGE